MWPFDQTPEGIAAFRDMLGFAGAACVLAAGLFAVAWSGIAELVSRMRDRMPGPGAALVAVLVAAMVAYGATKRATPTQEQCDFRLAGSDVLLDSRIEYWRNSAETGVVCDVAMCAGLCTNEVAFAPGAFYWAYDVTGKQGIPTEGDSFWVRDADTNDWTASEALLSVTNLPGWIPAFRGKVSTLPGGENPKAFRYWFIGPEENLPEKVTVVGEGIEIVGEVRDAFHVFIEFKVDDEHFSYQRFVLESRRVDDNRVLRDWETVATTEGRTFNVVGFTCDRYTEFRIYGDRERRQ